MEALGVLIIAPAKTSGLFEQVVSHAQENTRIALANDEADVGRILLSGSVHCIIVDWEVDFLAPDLFPRALQRVATDEPRFTIAIVRKPEELHAALSAGYNFALKLEFSRATYYTISSILALINRITTLSAQLKSLEQERDTIQATAEHFVNVIERLQAQRIPEYTAVAQFAHDSSQWILQRLEATLGANLTDPKQLMMAARLYALARVAMGDELVRSPIHREGVPHSALAASVPTIAGELLEHLVEYPETRLILLTMYENYDGTGFPNRSQGWHIPLGARILRVVVDFAELVFRDGLSMLDALSTIEQYSRRIYDQRVVVLLGEYIAQHITTTEPLIALRIEDLSPGMRLGRDVITSAGHKLAARGTKLSAEQIERILTHHSTDPIIGRVYVHR